MAVQPEDGASSDIATKKQAAVSPGPWDDPGWLIENFVRGRQFSSEDPETVLIAWTMALGSRIRPCDAAASLFTRLSRLSQPDLHAPEAAVFRLLSDIARGRLLACARR